MLPIPNSQSPITNYLLHLADNALILGHRNSEWCGHGPVLEQDIAITNISLDLIGQSRNFYQYAAALANDGSTEDSFAYLRDVRGFCNCLLTELPKGDWAVTILRQFFFSNYQSLLFEQLQHSNDEQLSAIAVKSLKEVAYHLRWSSEWVIRLGDGTVESRERVLNAIDSLWPYTGEFFQAASYERGLVEQGRIPDPAVLKPGWMQTVDSVFEEATLPVPGEVFMQMGGKEGKHTEHLGYLLAEMQFLQRAYPGSEW